MLSEFELRQIAHRFYHKGVTALVLTGSYATGEADPFSDIDFLRFISADRFKDKGSHLIEGYLFNVSDIALDELEKWFTEPEVAVNVIVGIRQARALFDEVGIFAQVQKRALEFRWDEVMQEKANRWASEKMLGWVEEVHKGLGGLRRYDSGRLLQARFGLSWGLAEVVQVQRGILSTDNSFFDDLAEAVGKDSAWSNSCRTAFGLSNKGTAPNLQEEVQAGLNLYIETAKLLQGELLSEIAPVIAQTVQRIIKELGGQ